MQQRLEQLGKPQVRTDPYNKSNKTEQWIRLSTGCPNNCPYCYEPTTEVEFEIPKIERNLVKIMDMNLLSKPNVFNTITYLANQRVDNKVVHYELICGIDYRYLNENLAILLKESRFQNIRVAWDWGFNQQLKIVDAIKLLLKAGYKPNDITIFMICNWKISYEDNLKKLDLCKVWNVKVADCWFDNQLSPKIIPIQWTDVQIKDFRHKCRKHNQLVRFKIDPELRESVIRGKQ